MLASCLRRSEVYSSESPPHSSTMLAHDGNQTMNPPTAFEACFPRDDVLQDSIAAADFAADLANMIRGNATDDYQLLDRFFTNTNTYATVGLRSLRHKVLRRLIGGSGAAAAIFRLDTSYGGGKTHGLIATAHAANGIQGVSNVSEFVDLVLVPKGKVRVGAFDGENADSANGRAIGEGVLAHTSL